MSSQLIIRAANNVVSHIYCIIGTWREVGTELLKVKVPANNVGTLSK